MGVAYGGLCYVDAAAARSAHCQLGYPRDFTSGTTTYTLSCTGTTATALSLARTQQGSTVVTPLTVPSSYAACDETQLSMAILTPELAGLSFTFGLTGVLICYVMAFAAGQVLNAIRGR